MSPAFLEADKTGPNPASMMPSYHLAVSSKQQTHPMPKFVPHRHFVIIASYRPQENPIAVANLLARTIHIHSINLSNL